MKAIVIETFSIALTLSLVVIAISNSFVSPQVILSVIVK